MKGWLLTLAISAVPFAVLGIGLLLRRARRLWQLVYWLTVAIGMVVLFNMFR